MAEDKKSFILYADLIHDIDHLTNEEKGILFNHLLEYVNDMNPVLDDRLLITAWKPIKAKLNRDLDKYKEVKSKRSEAGRRSAELRALKSVEQNPTNSTSVESVQQTSTNPTVSVNGNVNVNVNDILLEKETKEGEQFQSGKNELVNAEIETSKKVAPKKVSFEPPDPNEVQDYCNERNNGINGHEFCDFYTSKGWMVGKNKMKDWRASVRTWEKNRNNGITNNGRSSNKISGRATINPDYIHPEFT